MILLAAAALIFIPKPGAADRLKGSRSSLVRQVGSAERNDYTFLDKASDVRRFTSLGLLVELNGNRDYRLSRVSFPVGRPELKTFVERLAAQYRRACGEKLVVTSLTRPRSRQPPNAYRQSVHRAGMAADLRRSRRPACRRWLEQTLRTLERKGVLEATRERHPAHYHVAIFPTRYTSYVAALTRTGRARSSRRYEVRPGDTLWEIARRHRTSVRSLAAANDLRDDRITPGQTLSIPSIRAGDRTEESPPTSIAESS